ncbi:MAG: hypothetical protein HUU37_11460, partial [Bdellovibrionales bacterium]|nr:hypothetical protein [Bdellovibrionales bacterium]
MKKLIAMMMGFSLVVPSVLMPGAALAKLSEVEKERKIEDRRSEIAERGRDKRTIEDNINQIKRDKDKASRERTAAERAFSNYKRQIGRDKVNSPEKMTSEEKEQFTRLEKSVESARDKEADLTSELRAEQDKRRALDDEIIKREKEIAKLEGEEGESEDCPEGNCGGKGGGAGQEGKSTWTGVAEVLRAGTPLALGLFGIGYGVKSQKDDYRLYMNNCTSVGVPCAPPNGYGGIIGSALGAAMWGVGLMNGGGYGGGGMWGGYGGGYPGGSWGIGFPGIGFGGSFGGGLGGWPFGGGFGGSFGGGFGGPYFGGGFPYGGGFGGPYMGGGFGGPYFGGGFGSPYGGGFGGPFGGGFGGPYFGGGIGGGFGGPFGGGFGGG